ncbi:probable helicase with zinc finger domain isoform X2 [Dreissena polymorpha]|nr:probable helicase with zinc finger domain isoform X2 [Dreissena polymorpha]
MTLQTDVWYRPQDSHNIQSYKDRMHTFLYAEEVAQMKIVSRMNVICNMTPTDLLESIGNFPTMHATEGQLFARIHLENDLSIDSAVGRLVLQIESVWLKGLNESSGIDTKRVYESSISHIEHDVITVRLSQTCVRELKLLNGRKCRVEIQMQLNRQAFCEMHHAVDNMESASFVYPLELEPVLPDECDGKLSIDGYGIKPCNEYQFATIRTIARPKIEGEPPILIVGPFGTGKTYTIAQAAIFTLQQPNTRILICTHSNSEADLYVTKYFHPLYMEGNKDTKPLRVYYEKRWPESVSQIVQKYCLMKYKAFRQPTKEEIDEHRIIITTLRSSKLVSRLASKGIFTHIMLDEAAQVLETELLIPLSLAGPGTKVVLAGDPMQIGPEVYSKLGRKENFNVSMLERLDLTYAFNTQYKVKLCQNYRTTSAIIDFMSELFYDCQLEATENPPPHPDVHALAFYVARGEDASLEIMNDGYYNVAEVKEIVERVEELKRTWPERHWGRYDQSKICVIAPYRAQILYLRSELKERGFSKVNVERVNNVQGKEFKVTIISTVRTRKEGMEDVEHVDLAFLSNPKFLVTAMTRAQSQVIVVGEPVTLSVIGECRDIWKRFIEVCHEHGSFHGLEWEEYRRQCFSAESKLNPEAPEFVPRVCID